MQFSRDVQEALTQHELLAFDCDLMTGIIPPETFDREVQFLPAYHECRAYLDDIAERAGTQFGEHDRAGYYLDRTANIGREAALEQFLRPYHAASDALTPFVATRLGDFGLVRDCLVELHRRRLMGEVTYQYARAVRQNLPRLRALIAHAEALQKPLPTLAVRKHGVRSPGIDSGLHLAPSDALGMVLLRAVAPNLDAQLPSIDGSLDLCTRVVDASIFAENPIPEMVLYEDRFLRVHSMAFDPSDAPQIFASTAGLFFLEWRKAPSQAFGGPTPDVFLTLALDRNRHELVFAATQFPLRRYWAAFHDRLLDCILPPLEAAYEAAHAATIDTLNADALRTYAAEMSTRAALQDVAPAIVAGGNKPRKYASPPTVHYADALRAGIRLLGPPLRSNGSHHVFAARNGGTCTLPIHTGDLPYGTFVGFLKDAGVTRDEFYAAMR